MNEQRIAPKKERSKKAWDKWVRNNPEKYKAKTAKTHATKSYKDWKRAWKRTPEQRLKSNLQDKKMNEGYELAPLRFQHWDSMDDCFLLESPLTNRTIAGILGRSLCSVQSRKNKLNKMEETP